MQLMYALESGCYDEIMSWSPSGLAFVIVNPQSFEKKVLPDLFKEAKFSSFDRKVRAISNRFYFIATHSSTRDDEQDLQLTPT